MRGGEYKCRILKKHLKLRNQQLKITIYILLYDNLMVTANQKSVRCTHKKEKNNSNITLKSHQITREENKRRKGKKRSIETNPKQLTR